MKFFKFTWSYQGRQYEIIEGFPKDMNIVDCWASFVEHTSKTCYSGSTTFSISPLKTVIIK